MSSSPCCCLLLNDVLFCLFQKVNEFIDVYGSMYGPNNTLSKLVFIVYGEEGKEEEKRMTEVELLL